MVCFAPMSRRPSEEPSRRRQILVGFGVIVLVSGVIMLCWLGRMAPGFLGEWFGMVAGIATTPFLMEASLFLLGLLAVLVVNHWRHTREGDELVYLEQAEGPGTEALPESARWAVYRDQPPEGEEPDLLSRAEGAVEVGDLETAVECLSLMDDAERQQPAALRTRIRLAHASGHEELARRLEARLAQSSEG